MTQTVLITGSSSGIGKATAQHFQQRGWQVVATMRSPEKETVLTQLDNVLVTQLDVQDTRSINNAINAGIETFGRIDVLVNNAGYGAFGVLEAASEASIRRQFDVNVIGLLMTSKAILPHFRQQNSGMIINVSSIGGKMTFPLGTLYHGTKFAVEGISESLRHELATIGCHVKLVEPGMIATDFGGRSLDFFNDEHLTEYQAVVQRQPAIFEKGARQISPPAVVAEVIYQASTDGRDQLRYTAGEDAKTIMAARTSMDDEAFDKFIHSHYGF